LSTNAASGILPFLKGRLMTELANETNSRAFNSPRAVSLYVNDRAKGMTDPERVCLASVPDNRRSSVLDIGIGGGRTTSFLPAIFPQYIGFDYSPEQVAEAKKAFPLLDISVRDARSFDFGRQFDCILFSFNGIDYVSPEERPSVFDCVSRHLVEGGYFIYSTHNRRFRRVDDWLNSLIVAEMMHPWRWIKLLPGRVRNFWRQRAAGPDGYAVVNDPGLRFSLLTTYADLEAERAVLGRHGFDVVGMIGNSKSSPWGYDNSDNWVYVVARKTIDERDLS
jgi:SAM-dependent methyltransferase